jgi:hypothetical protein
LSDIVYSWGGEKGKKKMNITKIVEEAKYPEHISCWGKEDIPTTFPEHVLITGDGVLIGWSNIGKAFCLENVLASYCAKNKCTREEAEIKLKDVQFYDLESKEGEYSLWGTVADFSRK